MVGKVSKKDIVSLGDLGKEEIYALLRIARKFKEQRCVSRELTGKTLGLIFQKPSTRTSVSFAVGMYQLGGYSLILNASDLQLKRGETLGDTARTLSRYLNGIVIRANRHDDVVELAHHATIPVINGLTDKEHPCQVLGDILTILEAKRLDKLHDLKDICVAYLGDGNNVVHSWMLAAGTLGMKLVLSCPDGYQPEKEFRRRAESLTSLNGGDIRYESEPSKAVREADVVYTDVWASMGKDEERDHRRQVFSLYQVNEKLLAHCEKDFIVMHCLPAHRGEEITSGVMDGPHSVVFDQAENRMHIQKAILLRLMGNY